MSISKKLDIGIINHDLVGHVRNGARCTVEVELRDIENGLELAISGNIGRSHHGQIVDSLKEAVLQNKISYLNGWNRSKALKLINIWEEYHLNDMHAGCIHQRRIIKVVKKLYNNDYSKMQEFYDFEHISKLPEFDKCSECGYKYGSAWLFQELPIEVIQFLRAEVFGTLDLIV